MLNSTSAKEVNLEVPFAGFLGLPTNQTGKKPSRVRLFNVTSVERHLNIENM